MTYFLIIVAVLVFAASVGMFNGGSNGGGYA